MQLDINTLISDELYHCVESYSHDKTDRTLHLRKNIVQWKKQRGYQFGISTKYRYQQKCLYFVVGNTIRKTVLETPVYLLYYGVLILCRKIVTHRLRTSRREKYHFHCSLSHITLIQSMFVCFMYRLHQHTHAVNTWCALTPYISNILVKCQPEAVHVQWGYCGRGVRVI